jgi:hypothetical protein
MKKPLFPNPQHSPVGGGAEDLLHKYASYTAIIIESSLKMAFLIF